MIYKSTVLCSYLINKDEKILISLWIGRWMCKRVVKEPPFDWTPFVQAYPILCHIISESNKQDNILVTTCTNRVNSKLKINKIEKQKEKFNYFTTKLMIKSRALMINWMCLWMATEDNLFMFICCYSFIECNCHK